MGVPLYSHLEILKSHRRALQLDTLCLWRKWFGTRFPMIPSSNRTTRYSVGVDAVTFDRAWVSDVQDFYSGQEIDLLEYVECAWTEFAATHIFVCIKGQDGFIERSVTVGDLFC